VFLKGVDWLWSMQVDPHAHGWVAGGTKTRWSVLQVQRHRNPAGAARGNEAAVAVIEVKQHGRLREVGCVGQQMAEAEAKKVHAVKQS
jgi:hypothetical protein